MRQGVNQISRRLSDSKRKFRELNAASSPSAKESVNDGSRGCALLDDESHARAGAATSTGFLEDERLRTLVAGDVLGQLNGANEFAVEECPEDDGQAEESAHGQKSKIYAQHSPKREVVHCTQNQRKRCGCKYLQSCIAAEEKLVAEKSPAQCGADSGTKGCAMIISWQFLRRCRRQLGL